MDPKRRRFVRIAIVVLGVALILDGLLSLWTGAVHDGRTYVLINETDRVGIFLGEGDAPSDQAVIARTGGRFGQSAIHAMPDGGVVECRFLGPWVRCDGGYSLEYEN